MKKGIGSTDDELEAAIKIKLRSDPEYYLNFLKGIIDEVPGTIENDEDLFAQLRPSFIQDPILDTIFFKMHLKPKNTSQKMHPQSVEPKNTSLKVSPESVDMLFDPLIRKKLKEWQQNYFDKTLRPEEQDKAKEKIQKVFTSLTYKGQGKPEKLSTETKARIRHSFRYTDKKCKGIFEKSKNSLANRHLLIKEKFPDVGVSIVKDIQEYNIKVETYEKLRNVVLAKQFNCEPRDIEKCINDFNLIQTSKYLSDLKVRSLTIKGTGKRAIIKVEKSSQ